MRYEDASQTGSVSDVMAHDDADHLAANDFGPATGNIISGSGTITGTTGTDMGGAQITAIAGAGGTDTTFDGGKLEIAGQYGVLSIDAQGNYSYARNPGTPDGVADVFTYTLANNAGATDTAQLTINIGDLPILQAQGTRVVPGPDGVVVLPAGVELSDVRVVGRDLVVTLPDGSTMVIVDGAIFVPQLVLGGVEVPATNLAALLVGSEPTPAAGGLTPSQQSGGGNFGLPPGPLDPGVPLGDLLPPTELDYVPPEFEDPGNFFEDNDPPLIGSAAANVSEEGLEDGLTDTAGSPDTTDSAVTEGDLPVSDPDGDPLIVTFTDVPGEELTSDGDVIVWALSDGNHVLTGSVGGNPIITVEIDNAGHYIVTLEGPVDHPVNPTEDGVSFVIPVQADDGDDITTGGSLTVTIEDDSPEVTATGTEPTLRVDETVLGTDDTANFAANFAVLFGADGPLGGVTDPTYELGVIAGPSGLVDTLSGQNVILSLNGDVVEGRTATSDELVFTVTVDADGNVELDQLRAVVHDDPADHDEDGEGEPSTLSADNLVTLTASVTDNDGDPASATLNIGQNLLFEDDGPSLSIDVEREPLLVVDETDLDTDAGPASFVDAIIVDYGEDGPKDDNNDGVADDDATAYSLSVIEGPSGLFDTATGQAVHLSVNEFGVVEGRTVTSDELVFTVSVNGDGEVSLDQIRAVVHPDNPDQNEWVTLSSDDLVKLNITVEDGDGDTDSESIDIGQNLRFHDDGPSVGLSQSGEPNLRVDESTLTANAGPTSFAGVFTHDFGADGPLDTDHNGIADANALDYDLGVVPGPSGLVDTLSGEAVILSITAGGVVEGRTETGDDLVFTVSVTSEGAVTLDQVRAVVHDDPLDDDESGPGEPSTLTSDNLVTLTLTVTDGDGDSVAQTIGLGSNLLFEDDGPSMSNTGAQPDLVVDETTLGTDDSADFSGAFSPLYGADGPKDDNDDQIADDDATTYQLGVIAGPSGLVDTITGENVILSLNGDVVEGRTAGTDELVFTVSVDADGIVTLDQDRAVVHGDPSDHDEADTPAMLSADNLITLTATAEDGDGDTASATIDIGRNLKFEDDGPSITRNGQTAPSLVTDDTDTPNATDGPVSFAGLFTGVFGADGPKDDNDDQVADADAISYDLSLADGNGTVSGLFDVISGDSILLRVVGDTIEGYLAGTPATVAFTITLDPATGEISMEQDRAITHDDPLDPVEDGADAEGMAADLIVLTATIEDGDGDTDTATADIGDAFSFEDDGPSIVRNTTPVPDLVTDDTNTPNDTDGPVSFAGLFTGNFGKDGFKDSDDNNVEDADAISYELSIDGGDGTPSGLFDVVTGDAILLRVDGNTIEGYLENSTGTVAFTLTLNPDTGQISQEQDRAITHDDPLDPVETGEDAETMAPGLIILTATIEDGDGDTDTATAEIGDAFHFEDDGPSAEDDTDTVGAPLSSATGNVITDASAGDDGDTDDGADDVGADTPGSVVGVAAGDTDTVLNDTDTVGVVIQGDFGKLTLNSNGSYTYTRDAGSPGGGEDVFTYTLADADGDMVTATLTIAIADAIPIAGTDIATVDDDGLLGSPDGVLEVGVGDIDANVGETPATNVSEAIYNGTLNASGGDAPLTFVLVLPAANATVGQETVSYSLNPAGTLLTATILTSPDDTREGDPLFTVELVDTSTGDYVVTLLDNVLHGDDANDNEDLIEVAVTVPYQVEDADGSPSAANGQLTIRFNDDIPTLEDVGAGDGVTLDELNFPFPISDTSTDPVIDYTAVFGADGEATEDGTVFGLQIVGGDGTSSGLRTAVGNHLISLEQIDANTIQGHYNGSNIAFIIDIDSDGRVTLTQNVPLEHLEDGGPAPTTDHNDALDLDGLIEATVTIEDADGDQDSASVQIGDNLVFLDDGPDSEVDGQVVVPTLTLDETRPIGDDEDSGDDDPAGLATVSVGFASNFQTADYGADGAGTTTYALVLAGAGAGEPSGLYALDNTDTDDGGDGDGYGQGDEILLFAELDGSITGRTTDGGDPYFTISVDGDGEVTFTQSLNVWHADPADDDDSSGLSAAAETLQLEQTVTDSDGDFDTALIDLSDGVFFIEDDGPEIIQVTDAVGDNEGPTPTAEGIFDFDIGTDSPNGGNDDIFIDPATFLVSINGGTQFEPDTFSETSEDEHTAEFEFSFTYATGDGSTDTRTGTLIFYKDGSVPGHAAGTYEVVLDGTIAGFSTVSTSSPGTTFVEHSDEVVVAELADNLFAQFTAMQRPSNGNPLLRTEDYPLADPGADADPNNAWVTGELFDANVGNVQVSATDAGVDGNTVQTGEVLDFNLYDSAPGATPGGTPTASATDMFLTFFQIADDDLIIILKLFDPDSGDYTTRAVMISASDMFHEGDATDEAAVAGTAYASVYAGLGATEALVVIEANDYNADGENWVIVGAQIATDNDGVTGTGIDLDGELGVNGASDRDADGDFNTDSATAALDEQDSFATDDVDTSNIKITSIGFLVESTEDQSATLDFDVTVTDADGDSETTPISVQIGDPPVEELAFSSMETSRQSAEGDTSSFSLLAGDSFGGGEQQMQRTAANSNNTVLAAAIGAAGFAASYPAAAHDFGGDFEVSSFASAVTGKSFAGGFDGYEGGGGHFSSLMAGGFEAPTTMQAMSSSSTMALAANHIGQLSADLSLGNTSPNALLEATEMMTMNTFAAPTAGMDVAMPSIDMLVAAGMAGNVQTNQVVGRVIADALQGGAGGPGTDIDAMLNALPGQGLGENAAVDQLASLANGNVPGGDMAFGGGFTFDVATLMTAGALVLHADAVQPAANG